MALSLDQEIGRKTDALRRMDPRVAQAQAKQSDDFLSLIALQKLKSEKDAAQRDLALKMEQRPETIAKQREEELLKRNKDELLKQTAGIMNVAQQRQQQNLQRAAQQPPAQPRAAAPMQRGMGSLAGQVRPEIARMAGGGIVGYQQGTLVDGEEEEEVDEYSDIEVQGPMEGVEDLSGYGYSPEVREKLGSRRRFDRNRRRRLPKFKAPSREELRGLAGQYGYGEDASREMIRQAGGTGDIPGATPGIAGPRAGQDRPMVNPPFPGLQPPSVGPGAKPRVQPRGGLESLTMPKVDIGKDVVAPKPDFSGVGGLGRGILGAAGLGGTMQANRDDSYKYLMGDDAARYQKLMDRLDALNKKQSDPTDLGLRQFQAWASGIGRKGLGAGAPALMAERDRQAKAERERLAEMLGLEKELMTAQRGARSSALQQAMQDRRTIADIMRTTTQQERDEIVKQADRELEANINNRQAKIDKLKIEADNAYRLAVRKETTQQQKLKLAKEIMDKHTELVADEIKNDMAIQVLRARKAEALKDEDAERAAEIERAIQKAEKAVILKVYRNLSEQGALDQLEQIQVQAGLNPNTINSVLRRGRSADEAIARRTQGQ